MQNYYDLIYLAPHLDDVALSCGGQIYTQACAGRRILVATIMAGDPPPLISAYAHSLHDRWELPLEATQARRQEDILACALLGADAQHGAIPDCIYRLEPDSSQALYQSDAALFGPLHPADKPLIDATATFLATLPSHGRLIAPLGVGNHVDHQIVQAAAARYAGPNLTCYEDYPYVQTPGSLNFLHAAAKEIWEASVMPLTDEALSVKIEAILAYRSQLSTFFKDRADLEQQVTGYARRVGGERLWTRQPSQAPAPLPPG